MARPDPKRPIARGRQVPSGNTLPFGKKSQILFGAGFFVILVGYYLLSKNSITLAPILLVLGYCVLIPLAILAK